MPAPQSTGGPAYEEALTRLEGAVGTLVASFARTEESLDLLEDEVERLELERRIRERPARSRHLRVVGSEEA